MTYSCMFVIYYCYNVIGHVATLVSLFSDTAQGQEQDVRPLHLTVCMSINMLGAR
jgi:hypothetical protein